MKFLIHSESSMKIITLVLVGSCTDVANKAVILKGKVNEYKFHLFHVKCEEHTVTMFPSQEQYDPQVSTV